MTERTKVAVGDETYRMTATTRDALDELATQLGIPRNALVSVAISMLYAQMSPMLRAAKAPAEMLARLEKMTGTLLGHAKALIAEPSGSSNRTD